MSYPEGTAAAEGFATCHTCNRLSPASASRCSLCGSSVHLRTPDSLQRTMALVATAALLYIPANVLPIMTTAQFGRPVDSTILGGVVILLHHGSYAIAGVIFVASVMVPISKLLALSVLCWSVHQKHTTTQQERTRLYRLTELVGKWSMTDVFVVAILVALIQMGGLLNITAGPAAIAFGGVVMVTMVAAESFDSRLIWDHVGDNKDG